MKVKGDMEKENRKESEHRQKGEDGRVDESNRVQLTKENTKPDRAEPSVGGTPKAEKANHGVVTDESKKSSTNKEAPKLPYFGLASIFLYVGDVLRDVLQCLHLVPCTRVFKEMSLLSMEPDVLVVRWHTTIILVVQVMDPGEDGSKVVSDEMNAGLSFDHAMGMRQMGIDHPFVCLSTYNYMRIGSLYPSSKEIFAEARSRLQRGPLGDGDTRNKKSRISPEKRGNRMEIPDDSKQIKLDDDKKMTHEPSLKRTIYFSSLFDRKNIFQALYFAIACGIVAAERSTNGRSNNLVPKEGEQLDRCVAVVDETTLLWKTLKGKATYQLKRTWDTPMKVYLHCVLGYGRSGKVYLGSDSKGQMFAVKLYLFASKTKESFSSDDSTDEEKSQSEIAVESRDAEARKWTKLYPHYKEAIHRGELFGVPCLAMPYVALIPVTRRERLLPAIQQELERCAHEGFTFDVSHLYWRNIGMRKDKDGKEQIILVHLESLEDQGPALSSEGLNNFVGLQIIELGRLAQREPVYGAQEFFHAPKPPGITIHIPCNGFDGGRVAF